MIQRLVCCSQKKTLGENVDLKLFLGKKKSWPEGNVFSLLISREVEDAGDGASSERKAKNMIVLRIAVVVVSLICV